MYFKHVHCSIWLRVDGIVCSSIVVKRWDVPLLGIGGYLFLLAFAAVLSPYGTVCVCEMEKANEIYRVAFYAWELL